MSDTTAAITAILTRAAECLTTERVAAAAVYGARPSIDTRRDYEEARRAEVAAWNRVHPVPRTLASNWRAVPS